MDSELQRELEHSAAYAVALTKTAGREGVDDGPEWPGDDEAPLDGTAEDLRTEPKPTANDGGPPPVQPKSKLLLADGALCGLAGEIVNTIRPYTEADLVALLITLLVMFGNAIGAGPHFLVEYTKHYLRLFVALVGLSARGRKGQSLSTLRHVFNQVDPDWAAKRIVSGLSSGEGLIYHVRDELWGLDKKGEPVVLDAGEKDKRLFVIEEELASLLKVMSREGNTVSPIARQAWDRGDLQTLTKNSPLRATGAHIGLLSHITLAELLRHFSATEQANGFGNRIIWLWVERSGRIARPTGVPDEQLSLLVERLKEAVAFARSTHAMDFDHEAGGAWGAFYNSVPDYPGLFGAIVARAEAQVMRLACLYALLDCSAVVKVEHLKAALALWDYSQESVRLIFGDSLGDLTADRILTALRNANAAGLTDNDIVGLFNRHKPADELARAKNLLLSLGRATSEKKDTGGRPCTVWRAAS